MTTPSAPRISEDELARLEELAREATPGPWWHARSIDYRSIATLYAPVQLIPGQGAQGEYDAAYIAALSPDVVLRLIAAARSAPAAGLDAAWAEAEAALPERWWLETDDAVAAFAFSAAGPNDERDQALYPNGRITIEASTPAAALRALAAALREPKP